MSRMPQDMARKWKESTRVLRPNFSPFSNFMETNRYFWSITLSFLRKNFYLPPVEAKRPEGSLICKSYLNRLNSSTHLRATCISCYQTTIARLGHWQRPTKPANNDRTCHGCYMRAELSGETETTGNDSIRTSFKSLVTLHEWGAKVRMILRGGGRRIEKTLGRDASREIYTVLYLYMTQWRYLMLNENCVTDVLWVKMLC